MTNRRGGAGAEGARGAPWPSLLLMRHAKSDWTASFDHDRDRPLNGRGRKAARAMGRFLTGIGQQPDRAISSPARRARDTLDLAARAGRWTCPTAIDDHFYDHGPIPVIQHLRTSLPPGASSVLVVGHNPAWPELVELLTGADVRFPTAAVARIELDVSCWSELAAGTGRLAWLVPPRLVTRRGSALGPA